MQRSSSKIEAGAVTFTVRHEQWDANIHDHGHPDQGVMILVNGAVDGKNTTLLRFNCCDVERSYVYAPEGKHKICHMDPIIDGNPVGRRIRQLRSRLPQMLTTAGFEDIAGKVDAKLVSDKLDEVEAVARDAYINGRRTVKHNRGTDMFEAGNIRFGLELRELNGDGGLAIHVLSDLAGAPGDAYTEETELLAFDCFRDEPHYHYGPRNKNHRVYFDKTVVPDPLEWTLTVLKAGKLKPMIEAAGYPGVAADLDEDLIRSLLPGIEAKAREMQPKKGG